jgi:hypothetical protein
VRSVGLLLNPKEYSCSGGRNAYTVDREAMTNLHDSYHSLIIHSVEEEGQMYAFQF